MSLPVEPDPIQTLHDALLDWFNDHQRALPWRGEDAADPYHVLVREVMLQQTRMTTALPYYEAWLERWPTPQALANATEDDVLAAWQGLGYYNRARWLLEAAREIVDEHDGHVPQTVDALEELPGVGPYTAGAIASMAFGKPAPSVDGNMARVVARIEAEPFDATRGTDKREIRRRLEPLFERGEPGRLNEALMELGSLVCTPTSPDCHVCPAAAWCSARARDAVDQYPKPQENEGIPEQPVAAFLVQDATGRVLFRKRPVGGLLGGLWGLPMEETSEPEPPTYEGEMLSLEAIGDGAVACVEHAFSHKQWSVRIYPARVEAVPAGESFAWRALDAVEDLALSTLDRKVLQAVEAASVSRLASS